VTNALSNTKIDRLGIRLRKGEVAEPELRLLDDFRRSFGRAYEHVIETLKHQLALQPSGRPAKSTGSVIEKLNRESIRLSQMQDIAGCRVVVAGISGQETVIASLRKQFRHAVIVDRRSHPSYGYRAVHVMVGSMDRLVELQVRTTLQHLWAELSEKFSDVVDPAIKYGGGEEEIRELLLVLSKQVSRVEALEQPIIVPGRDLPGAAKAEIADLKRQMAETTTQITPMVDRWLKKR